MDCRLKNLAILVLALFTASSALAAISINCRYEGENRNHGATISNCRTTGDFQTCAENVSIDGTRFYAEAKTQIGYGIKEYIKLDGVDVRRRHGFSQVGENSLQCH